MVVGVHLDGHKIRVCGVSTDGRITHTACHERSKTTTVSEWVDSIQDLTDAVRTALPDATQNLYLAVPPGVYQMRRVPLEVAEEVDRRSQVTWEVQQALFANQGDYLIEYVARGSAAVWIALPSVCIESLTSSFSQHDVAFTAVCAEPIAMAHALRQLHPRGRARALRATSEWISSVELNDGTLVTASTDNTLPTNLSAEAGTGRTRRDILQRHIGVSSPPTYFVGDVASAPDPEIAVTSISAMPFAGTTGHDCSDTLMTLAYGAALSGISQAAL